MNQHTKNPYDYIELLKSLKYSIFSLDGKKPIKTSLVTFFSFFLVGLIPLSPFVLAIFSPMIQKYQFSLSIILTGFAFFGVGAVRGKIVQKHFIRSSFETLIIGGIAAIIAFLVGYLLKTLIL